LPGEAAASQQQRDGAKKHIPQPVKTRSPGRDVTEAGRSIAEWWFKRCWLIEEDDRQGKYGVYGDDEEHCAWLNFVAEFAERHEYNLWHLLEREQAFRRTPGRGRSWEDDGVRAAFWP